MKRSLRTLFHSLSFVLIAASQTAAAEPAAKKCPEYLNHEVKKLHSSKIVNLCSYYNEGKPIVVVNTASQCGYTPQFKELESLYQKYKDDGLVILGFPSDSFNQEEKTEAETASVCYKNYGVSFPMFTHVSVKGADAHELFKYLSNKTQSPSWNFNKYLVNGETVVYFPSTTKPLNSDLEKRLVF